MQKKRADKIKLIREWLSGADITKHVLLPATPPPRWFNKNIINGEPQWFVDNQPVDEETFNIELNTARQRGEYVWEETKTYKDPQPRLIEPARQPELPQPDVNPQPEQQTEDEQENQPKVIPIDPMKARLQAYEQEFAQNARENEQRKELQQANDGLNVHIIKLLS